MVYETSSDQSTYLNSDLPKLASGAEFYAERIKQKRQKYATSDSLSLVIM